MTYRMSRNNQSANFGVDNRLKNQDITEKDKDFIKIIESDILYHFQ